MTTNKKYDNFILYLRIFSAKRVALSLSLSLSLSSYKSYLFNCVCVCVVVYKTQRRLYAALSVSEKINN